MSSSSPCAPVVPRPIRSMEYAEIGTTETPVMMTSLLSAVQPAAKAAAEIELSKNEFAARIQQERADAATQAEQRARQEYEAELGKLRGSVAEAIATFEAQRSDYFGRVEAEVVQLALSVAAKILHREAQVDPMLVAALVRMTIEKMHEGSSVTVRVSAGRAAAWQRYFAGHASAGTIRIVEDPELPEGECALETQLGTTHLGLERQLKEIEQGFFDLLALRPDKR